jgi:hypothetical protein
MQAEPEQHPLGHDAAVQMHAVPSAEQTEPEAQGKHAWPPFKHVVLLGVVTQAPVASQQPFGHEVASQTHLPVPALHSWPVPHGAQVAPPLPHAVFEAVTQAPVESQQPFGHVVALHAHEPPVHLVPTAHVFPHVPQLLLSVSVLTSQPSLSAVDGQCAKGLVQAKTH